MTTRETRAAVLAAAYHGGSGSQAKNWAGQATLEAALAAHELAVAEPLLWALHAVRDLLAPLIASDMTVARWCEGFDVSVMRGEIGDDPRARRDAGKGL